jgi:hypothetical protein
MGRKKMEIFTTVCFSDEPTNRTQEQFDEEIVKFFERILLKNPEVDNALKQWYIK